MSLRTALKQLSEMVFRPYSRFYGIDRINNTRLPYSETRLDNANVIMGPVLWGMRQMIEAPMGVEREGEIDLEHPMVQLVRKPNPYYTGAHMIMVTYLSLMLDGNAYWLKVRDGTLEPRELWYVPPWMVEPYAESDREFLEYYRYLPSGREVRLEVDDVVHIRYGIDPRNMRKGLSPLATALREVYTDEEASNFTASVLRNQGMPGVIITPANDRPVRPDDADEMKRYFRDRFRGDYRGDPFVLGAQVKVETFGWGPDKIDLTALRAIPEERVTALTGIPAAVVGFGSGLAQTKVGATMSELRRLAYENNIIPTQRMMIEEIDQKLLTEYDAESGSHTVFDLSEVRVLQEDDGAKVERINRAVVGGWLTVSAAQRLAGFPVDESQNLYLRRMTSTPVPAQIASKARRKRRASSDGERFYRYQVDERERLSEIMAEDLRGRFVSWGAAVAAAFRERAEESELRGVTASELKIDDELEYEIMASGALDELYDERGDEVLNYGPHYMRTAESTVDGLEAIYARPSGVSVEMEAKMITLAKDRERLLDLKSQTRSAITQAIRQGRAEDETLQDIADRIRDNVEAGPWSSPEVRSRIVARTEVRTGQNLATIEAARETGAGYVEVLDARLGPTDEFCEDINGEVVTVAQADALALSEHPNGTRGFAPVYEFDGEPSDVPQEEINRETGFR